MLADIIGKVSLMIYWYCKMTYNLAQNFFPKRLLIKNGGSIIYLAVFEEFKLTVLRFWL